MNDNRLFRAIGRLAGGVIKPFLIPLIILFLLCGLLFCAWDYVAGLIEDGLIVEKQKAVGRGVEPADEARSHIDSFEWRDENEYSLKLEQGDDGEWYVIEQNLSEIEGSGEICVLLDDYLKYGENFDKMYKAGVFDFSGTMLLMDDDDIDKILERIYEDYAALQNEYEKRYHFISKVYDYGTHEEQVFDENGQPMFDSYGEPLMETVKNDYPEWMPDDEWEHKLETEDELEEHFFLNDERVMLYEDEIKGELDEDGERRFAIKYQMVLSLMELIGYNQYETWGLDEDTLGNIKDSDVEEWEYGNSIDEDDYYISDTVLDEILEEFGYEYEWAWECYPQDAFKNELLQCFAYPDFEYIGYWLEYKEMPPTPSIPDEAFVHKIPAACPVTIQNGWERITYLYVPSGDDYSAWICVGRKVEWDVISFYEWIKEIAPEFTWDLWRELTELFPGSESSLKLIDKLEEAYERQLAEGTDWIVIVDLEECPQVGVRLGEHFGEELPVPNRYFDMDDVEFYHGEHAYEYSDREFEHLTPEEIQKIIVTIGGNEGPLSYLQQKLIDYLASKVGCAYSQAFHSDLTADVFDCSSLAYRVYRELGIDVSNGGYYTAAGIYQAAVMAGNSVSGSSALKPGDLVFYGGRDNGRYMGIYHVAIYVGDGMVIEALGKDYGVVYGKLRTNNIVGISRYL